MWLFFTGLVQVHPFFREGYNSPHQPQNCNNRVSAGTLHPYGQLTWAFKKLALWLQHRVARISSLSSFIRFFIPSTPQALQCAWLPFPCFQKLSLWQEFVLLQHVPSSPACSPCRSLAHYGICISEQKVKNTFVEPHVLDWKTSQLLQLFSEKPCLDS